MDTLATIQDLMIEKFDLKREELFPGQSLEALGLDSLSVIEFMFNIEDQFGIRIPEQQTNLKTIQDVVDLADQLRKEKSGGS